MRTANLGKTSGHLLFPRTVSSESLPLLPKPHAHGTALQNSHFIPHGSITQMTLLSPPHTFPSLPVQPLWGFFPFFTRPTFLHGGDPPCWQDGHRDPSRLKAALVRGNLLLPAAAPLQLMSCQSQGHRPEGCGKQHLAQAWREPQLREDRL